MKFTIDDNGIKITDFNPVQALKIARHLEKQGIYFYENILKNNFDRDTKAVLEFVLSEEKKHLSRFNDELDKIRQDYQDGFDEEDLVDFIDSGVFGKETQENFSILNDKIKALEYTIEVERKSIVFYESCQHYSENETTKSVFKSIIDEEKQHLEKLVLAKKLIE